MTRTTWIAVALALAALPLQAHAQQSTPAAATPNEATELQQKIGRLQQQAMQDPALAAARDSMNAAVRAAMIRLDPAAAAKLARSAAIPGEIATARAAADNVALTRLAQESSELQSYFNALQPRALADAQVAPVRQAFLVRVLERMKQIDPNTQQYVDRLGALQHPAANSAQKSGGGR